MVCACFLSISSDSCWFIGKFYLTAKAEEMYVLTTKTFMISTGKYHPSVHRPLWMALFSWVPVFVDWTKMTHLWGSKFVARVFSFKSHYNRKWSFRGYWNSWIGPSSKTMKIWLYPTKLKPSTAYLIHHFPPFQSCKRWIWRKFWLVICRLLKDMQFTT